MTANMLTPPYTPATASSIGGLTTQAEVRPVSIFAAASLMAYKIPITFDNGAVPVLSGFINEAKKQDPTLTADFRIYYDPVSPSDHQKRVARIYIPDEVHEQDHDTWKQVWKLRKALIAMFGPTGMEVEWAPCKIGGNDRAQSCAWELHTSPDGYSALRDRIHDRQFRLALLNVAVTQVGLLPSTHVWHEHHGLASSSGYIQLASPQDCWTLVRLSDADADSPGIPITFAGFDFRVTFSLIPFHLQPSSCTTIAAELRDPELSLEVATERLEEKANIVNMHWCSEDASVSGVHIMPDWIIANVATPMGAQAICEQSIDVAGPNARNLKTYFRQVFFMNGNPYNFKKGGIVRYKEARMDDPESDGTPSRRTAEFVVVNDSWEMYRDVPAQITESLSDMKKRLFRSKWRMKELSARNLQAGIEYRRLAQEVRELKPLLLETEEELADAKSVENVGLKRRRARDDPKFDLEVERGWIKRELRFLEDDKEGIEEKLEWSHGGDLPEGSRRAKERARMLSRLETLPEKIAAKQAELDALPPAPGTSTTESKNHDKESSGEPSSKRIRLTSRMTRTYSAWKASTSSAQSTSLAQVDAHKVESPPAAGTSTVASASLGEVSSAGPSSKSPHLTSPIQSADLPVNVSSSSATTTSLPLVDATVVGPSFTLSAPLPLVDVPVVDSSSISVASPSL